MCAMSQFLKNCSILRTKLSYEQQYLCIHIYCKFETTICSVQFCCAKKLVKLCKEFSLSQYLLHSFFPILFENWLEVKGKSHVT